MCVFNVRQALMQHDSRTPKVVLSNKVCILNFFPGLTNSDLTLRRVHSKAGPLGIPGSARTQQLPLSHQNQQDIGTMGKSYRQYGAEPLVSGGLEELRGISVLLLI